MDIQIESPEAGARAKREYLIKKFSKNEIQYYYFARVANQWNNLPEPKPANFEEYIKRFLERDEKASNWPEFDFSLENMKLIHGELFGNEFDENDKDFLFSLINPTKKISIINRIAGINSIFRNIYITIRIEELWNQGMNIFVVFGSGHLIIQEPALRKLLK